MKLNISRAFHIATHGEKWFEKLVVGALVIIIAGALSRIHGIGGIAHLLLISLTLGYSLRVMSSELTAPDNAPPLSLPEWRDWSKLLTDGLIVFAINFIWGISLIVLLAVEAAIFGTATLATLHHAALGQLNLASFHPGGPAPLIFLLVTACTTLLFLLLAPMAVVNYAAHRTFVSAFDLGTIFRKTFSHPENLLKLLGVGVVLLFVTLISIVTIIGLPFMAFISQVVLADLWAQLYRAAD